MGRRRITSEQAFADLKIFVEHYPPDAPRHRRFFGEFLWRWLDALAFERRIRWTRSQRMAIAYARGDTTVFSGSIVTGGVLGGSDDD